jgi:hypothetical protein
VVVACLEAADSAWARRLRRGAHPIFDAMLGNAGICRFMCGRMPDDARDGA